MGLKKNLLISCTLIFFSCKQEKKINPTKEKSIKETIVEHNKVVLSISKKEVVQVELPFGDERILKFFNKKVHTNKNPTNDYLSENEEKTIKEIDTKINNDFFLKKEPSISNFKYPQKNNYDFGFKYYQQIDSINTNKEFYTFSKQLPNVGEFKIYLANSNENIEESNSYIPQNIDLVVLDKNDKIINSLNLNYSARYTSNIYNDDNHPIKHFYIDKNYIIHIKYFLKWGEESYSLLAYIKYKIQEDGSIIRYFDQKEGQYKSYIEEGTIKENTKEGRWKEYLGGRENMYAIVNYKKGIIQGVIEIYGVHDTPENGDPEHILYPRFVIKLKGDKFIEI